MKASTPNFLQRFSPQKTVIKLLLGLVIASVIVGAGYAIFDQFISSGNSQKEARPTNLLQTSNNDFNDDPTIKSILNGINARSQMAGSQNQQINTQPLTPEQMKIKAKQAADNEPVVIGRVKNWSGDSSGNDSSVPQIVTSSGSSQIVNDPNGRQTQDEQQNAYKAPTKISLGLDVANSTSNNASSPLQAQPSTITTLTQQPTSRVSTNVTPQLSTMSTRSTGGSDGSTAGGVGGSVATADSSGYKPVSDGKGFAINTGSNDTDDELKVKPITSKYIVKKATFIPAILYSAVNSDTPGAILGRVRQNVYDSPTHKYLLIPKNSTLMGSYSTVVQYGQERVVAAWTALIFPDGTEIKLAGQPSTDVAGMAGLFDQVNRHYWSLFGTSFVLSVITAGMAYNQQQLSNNFNGGQSFGNALSQSTGQMMGQAATQAIQKGINISPTLTVRNGYLYNIFLTQDIVLPGPINVKTYP